MEENEIDIENRRVYVTARGLAIEDLLSDSSNQMTSFDFQDSKNLAGTRVSGFRGTQLIRTQRVKDETAGTTRRALMFTDDVIQVARSHNFELKNDIRADLAHVHQITSYEMLGAVRMEEKTIIDILFQ